MTLASHTFSPNETAAFGLFHSDQAHEAAMQNHVNPTWGSFLSMVAKEMKAQWTDPYLLTAGMTMGSLGRTTSFVISKGHSTNIFGKEIINLSTRIGKNGKAVEVIFKDGSKIDINSIRVKEWIPNNHPNAPVGTLLKIKFNNSIPGSKGYKRKPNYNELQFLNNTFNK